MEGADWARGDTCPLCETWHANDAEYERLYRIEKARIARALEVGDRQGGWNWLVVRAILTGESEES